MNKNKGFTLVELIGVVVIISLIAVIVFPAVMNAGEKKKEREYEAFKAVIKNAAEIYFERNRDLYPGISTENYRVFEEVSKLISAGLISKDLVNPKTEQKIDPTTLIATKALEDGALEFDYYDEGVKASDYHQSGLLWHFDGYTKPTATSWTDISGNGRNATLYNMDSNNWTGDGIRLDGVDDYIYLANSNYSILPSEHEFTLEYVITLGSSVDGGSYMCTYGLNHHYWCLYASKIFQQMNKNAAKSANNWPKSATLNVKTGETYTFAESFVYDSAKGYFVLTYYVNGKPVDTTSRNTSLVPYNPYLYVGRYTTNYFNGTIKSVRVYDKGLTDAQIEANYKVDANRF